MQLNPTSSQTCRTSRSPFLRLLGAIAVTFAVAACSSDGDSSWYNPMDWFDSDDEETSVDDGGETSETGAVSNGDDNVLADQIHDLQLNPARSGSILLVRADSRVSGFHSGRLVLISHGGDSAGGGNDDMLVYELRGHVPPLDPEATSTASRIEQITLGTFIPSSTLERNDRIKVIGNSNAVEIAI